MTEITGIIAEFNPFHKGHEFLLSQAEGIKVVAMSGNWMQRGEPAFIDKWARTEMALLNGTDLVIELPFLTAVNGADFFAQGAVDILHQLGITQLLFGSEAQTDYQKIAETYAERAEEMAAYMATLPELMSFPLKQEKAWAKFADVRFDGNTPNHILGLAYAKAARGTGIKLKTVQRETNYNSSEIENGLASASAIRQTFWQGNMPEIPSVIPENCVDLFFKAEKTQMQDFWKMLQYRIQQGSLTEVFQVNEEMANRITANYKKVTNPEALVEKVYTKRYTKGHIRRLLIYILMNAKDAVLPESIHVLGFTKRGQELLAQSKVSTTTRIGKKAWDETTQRADEIFELGNPKSSGQTYGRKPIIL